MYGDIILSLMLATLMFIAIKAEVINWQELITAGSYAVSREKGLIRTEGKDYIVKDGDVIEIKSGA